MVNVGDLLVIVSSDGTTAERMWIVRGIYLGCVGQENLLELCALDRKPGYSGDGATHHTVFVPEDLAMAGAQIYSKSP